MILCSKLAPVKEASPCLKCNDRVVPGPIPCFSESLIEKYIGIHGFQNGTKSMPKNKQLL